MQLYFQLHVGPLFQHIQYPQRPFFVCQVCLFFSVTYYPVFQ